MIYEAGGIGMLGDDEKIVPSGLEPEQAQLNIQSILDEYFGGITFEQFDRALRAGAYDQEIDSGSVLELAILRIFTYHREIQGQQDLAA